MTTERKPRRPTKYAGLTMKERAAARRQDLVEAGIELMGTRGIAATKVSDVCRRAELTERYFYESFPTLDAFTRAVVETVFIRSTVRIATAVLAEQSLREQGHAVIRECLSIVEDDPRVGRILLVETLRAGGELSQLRTTAMVVAANLLKMALDPSPEVDLVELMQRSLLPGLSGDLLPPELTESTDPLVLAMGGAVSEVLVGWIEKRITMSQEELGDFLRTMFDATFQSMSEGGLLARQVRESLRASRKR